MPKTELTNMCMVFDRINNKVLVQERVKGWKGITFPGGHVEEGESIMESVAREVKEETGLNVSKLHSCGIIHWFNEKTKDRLMIFLFKTDEYSGELIKETEEGRVFWVDVDVIPTLNLSYGFKEQLSMFFTDDYFEGFGVWRENNENIMTFL